MLGCETLRVASLMDLNAHEGMGEEGAHRKAALGHGGKGTEENRFGKEKAL